MGIETAVFVGDAHRAALSSAKYYDTRRRDVDIAQCKAFADRMAACPGVTPY